MSRRPLSSVLATTAACCYAAAYSEPMWGFYLQAPQYPQGLVLSIHLDGVAGDVREIDVLNHYIGMAKLESAATLERSLAPYGVGLVVAAAVLLALIPRHRAARLLAWPALLFPVVFLAGVLYWMYVFGTSLDPAAPVRIAPFMPTLLGHGRIGNFQTLGLPGAGFYLVLAGTAAVAAARLVQRRRGGAGTQS